MPNPLPTPTPPKPPAPAAANTGASAPPPKPPTTPNSTPAPAKPVVAPTPKPSTPAPKPITPAPVSSTKPAGPTVKPIAPSAPKPVTPGGSGQTPSASPTQVAPPPPKPKIGTPPPVRQPTAMASVPPAPGVRPIGAPPAGPAAAPQPPKTFGAAPPLPPSPPTGAAAPAPAAPAQTPPKAAAPRSSIFKFLPFIIGGLALLAVVAFLAMRFLGIGLPGSSTGPTSSEPTTLVYWGLWEPSELMQEVFDDFEAANPGITVEYIQQSSTDYRERLQTAISQGTGPDVFRFHATWVPMLRDDLAPVPSSAYTPTSFQSTFYPVASQQLQYNGQLRGIPLMYDGLALFYNEDMLRAADATPPTTWADLRILATELTVTNNGVIQRGGLAIGNATNVEHFPDILALLMLQNGADLSNPTSPQAREALVFYTDFQKTYQVWSDDLPSSTIAFARGDAAMMLAPSWRAHEINEQNPNLNFNTAPVPKLGTSDTAWATYWAEGVNSKSTKKDAAWKLLAYMSQADVQQKLFSEQAGIREFGELYSRQDLAPMLANVPLAAAFVSDAPQAQGWYMSSFTHDNGINDQIIQYYGDAITAVLGGTSAEKALQTVAQGVTQVLRQYGVAVSAPAQAPTTTAPGSQLSF